jgi:hypothetical protein
VTRGTHSLKPRGSKTRRLAVISAPIVTCAFVGVGVAVSDVGSKKIDLSSYAAGDVSAALGARTNGASRSGDRSSSIGAVVSAATLPAAKGRRWTTTAVDLRTTPTKLSRVHAEVAALKRLVITGLHRNGFAQVLVNHRAFWVNADYLAAKKPVAPITATYSGPIIGKACPAHSSVENGLTPRAITVFRAVCNAFPQITSYGGYSPHGEHSSGRAIDIMTSDVTLGTEIANFLRANAVKLHIYDVLWRQQIFTVERAGEGWRSMASRGSATANHYDHVHVSVY